MSVNTSEIDIVANLQGTEQVNAGLDSMASASERMATRVSQSSGIADMSYKRLMFTTAGLIMNTVQLGDIIDRVAKGQIDAGRAAIMFGMNLLQLGAQIITIIGLESARATAHAIANAVASLGVSVPIMLAAAAAAAGGVAALMLIPRMAQGGIVTAPTVLMAGEAGREAIVPLDRLPSFGQVTINVYESGDAQATAKAIMSELKRAGIL